MILQKSMIIGALIQQSEDILTANSRNTCNSITEKLDNLSSDTAVGRYTYLKPWNTCNAITEKLDNWSSDAAVGR